MNYNSFITHILDLYSIQESRRAVFHIFKWTDDRFCGGEFNECDMLLSTMPVEELDETILVGLMCSTMCAKEFLPNRNIFISKAFKHIGMLTGNIEYLEEIR